MSLSQCTTLFCDIGGVILSNGWDTHLREKAAKKFGLDFIELNKRHALAFDTYENGKMTLDEYLNFVVFYVSRSFTHEEFKQFMFSEWQAYPEMLEWIKGLKKKNIYSIVALSNEGRELMEARIKKFDLKEAFDFFVCSGFVGLRKPDWEIYRLALDLSQAKPEEVVYIEDRPLFCEIGRELGLQVIQHSSFEQTRSLLET